MADDYDDDSDDEENNKDHHKEQHKDGERARGMEVALGLVVFKRGL